MTDMTIIILTKDEEANINRCIESVKGLAKRIVVVDSGSTDKTVEIARSLGAEIYYHPWKHYAGQFNWALDNTDINTKWVFRFDADECMTPELNEEIVTECNRHQNDDVHAMMMRYKIFFLGRFLKHGGAYPFLKITIFKPEYGRFEDRALGEHVVMREGRTIDLKNDCIHYDFKDLTSFVDKHNKYATRELADYLDIVNGRKLESLYGQPEKARKLRDNFYYKMPLFWRAKLYYWYRYYVRMGFLDGTPGKVFAFIQAYFYRFLVDAKIYENSIGGGKFGLTDYSLGLRVGLRSERRMAA